MTPAPHRLPAELLAALARGGGGAPALDRLRAGQRSKTSLLIRCLVSTAGAAGHPEGTRAEAAWRALSRVARAAPGATAGVLSYPSVSAWATRTMRLFDTGREAQARPGELAAVAAAAALRGGVPVPVPLPPVTAGHRTIDLPSVGRVSVPGEAPADAGLVWEPAGPVVRAGRLRVPVPAGPAAGCRHWRGVESISVERAGLRLDLVLDDLVLADLAPEGLPPAAPAGPAERDRWAARLAAGWRLLVDQHRPVAEEVAAAFTVLAPLPSAPSSHRSGTFRHGFGCVVMSLPADPRAVALSLAHEVQHAKLGALMDLFPLSYGDGGRRHYVPWRDDPRPLAGLLQGAYAHLGVAGFWRRQRHREQGPGLLRAQVEFARWRSAVDRVVRVLLASQRLTPVGRLLAAGMREELAGWWGDPVPPLARTIARELAERHYQRWRHRHDGLR